MTGPAVRTWVVDGNNVMGSRPDGWWRDRVGAAVRLADRLAALATATGDAVLLVLDGRPSTRLPAGDRAGIRVVYARRAGRDAADDEIVARLRDDPVLADADGSLVVATSDRALAERVRAVGVAVVGAGALLAELDRFDPDGSTAGRAPGEDPRRRSVRARRP